MAESTSPLHTSGLSDAEAKEFHSGFVSGMIGWLAIAVVAHLLTWMWRPWFPGTSGFPSKASSLEQIQTMMSALV